MRNRNALVDQYGNPLPPPAVSKTSPPNQTSGGRQGRLPSAKASAGSAAVITAVISGIGLVTELHDLAKNETIGDEERRKRQGGAVGEFGGNVAGAAAGAFIGSLILPGVGTMLGSMIGSQLAGMAGRWGGETLGAWKDRTQRELDAAQSGYEEAPEEAADTIGKTEEEIENARRKLAEAETRLEKAKEASVLKKAEEEKKKSDRDRLMNAWASGYNRSGGPVPATYGGYGFPGLAIPAPDNGYQTAQGMSPGLGNATTRVDDLIVTPRGQFNTHPDDYIIAMKNPAALINSETRDGVRTVERVPPAIPPVVVEGEIELRSEFVIDDKGYRLKQSVGKNTTPYKFTVGSARNARLIQ